MEAPENMVKCEGRIEVLIMATLRAIHVATPPDQRQGVATFRIIDIFHRLLPHETDPFVLWQEIPECYHKTGTWSGAPMHPHRGFMECPYMKDITSDTGQAATTHKLRAGGEINVTVEMPGYFELAMVGIGMEHEMKMDKRWSGNIHCFQLWVNMPSECKTDAPFVQTVVASALPIVKFPGGIRAKILHGEIGEVASPTECEVLDWQYIDWEVPAGKEAEHWAPMEMTTKMVYVYQGSLTIGRDKLEQGMFAILDAEDGPLQAKAGSNGCKFLFIAGTPIGEPVVMHGPFVMCSNEEIRECFSDLQKHNIAPKKAKQVQYT